MTATDEVEKPLLHLEWPTRSRLEGIKLGVSF